MNTIDAIALLAATLILGIWIIWNLIEMGGHFYGTWYEDMQEDIENDKAVREEWHL